MYHEETSQDDLANLYESKRKLDLHFGELRRAEDGTLAKTPDEVRAFKNMAIRHINRHLKDMIVSVKNMEICP